MGDWENSEVLKLGSRAVIAAREIAEQGEI